MESRDTTGSEFSLEHFAQERPRSDKTLYIEPFSGISGDMFVAALLDLGQDFAGIKKKLALLPIEGYGLEASRCSRAGIRATRFHVHCDDKSHHRHEDVHGGQAAHHRNFREIRQMIESSSLSAWVKDKSVEAFRRLAAAEGKVHDRPPEEVHFHEVGAVDSIIDIVGTMIAVEEMAPDRILSAPVNLGQGSLECQHGLYPAPGPATLELLLGLPVYSGSVTGELTTPTGAALLATLVDGFEPRPLMRVRASGYGAGARETAGAANVLRLTLGENVPFLASPSPGDQVAVIEANIDDMNPQIYGYFMEKAFAQGFLDVYLTPVQMKKNRPATKITVICGVDRLKEAARLIFTETATIGLRYTFAHRMTLRREIRRVETEFGPISVKLSFMGEKRVNFVPEYEDCSCRAAERGVPLKEVIAAATRAFLALD